MSASYVCQRCRATAIRTARATLEVLEDVDASEASREIAAEELGQVIALLRHAPGLRADE